MAIPIFYSIRNLRVRALTTALTAAGMALVVFVFAAVLMMAEGLRKTLAETGSPDNVVLIRKGSGAEVQSGIERLQASVIESQPEVAIGETGKRLLAKELVVLITLPKRDGGSTTADTGRNSGNESMVQIRGFTDASLALRPQVRLVSGRMPRPGSTEIMAGQSIARGFRSAGLGESLRFAMREWTVVGVFDADKSGFNSEIWGDADQLMQSFRRPVYSSIVFKLRDSSAFDAFKARIEADPRLTLEAKRETRYYEDQSEMMATFLRILGVSLTIIFSAGAIIGAMITMYSAVATRTAEIGTMRALGFHRRGILGAFLMESLLLGLIGGVVGLFCASFMQLVTVSTVNFQTFSELAFTFSLNMSIASQAILFALGMGLAGGVLPAWRASQMKIVEALRAG